MDLRVGKSATAVLVDGSGRCASTGGLGCDFVDGKALMVTSGEGRRYWQPEVKLGRLPKSSKWNWWGFLLFDR